MIPGQVDYATAHSVREAIGYLEAHPTARVLAGGTELIPALTRRLLTASALLDLQHIPGLADLTPLDSGGLRLGALATLAATAEIPAISTRYPVLAEALAATADPQIRQRATLGGSVLQRRSGGDVAAALLCLDAQVTIAGPAGERSVGSDTLLGAAGAGGLGPAEILTALELPPGDAAGSAYEKVRNPASGLALCGAAALLRVDSGTVSHCRVAITGATASATRLLGLEALLVGEPATLATLTGERIAAEVATLTIAGDWPASAEYRAHLAQVLARRALRRAAARATSN
jgi:carbon-monoxide dehydrogenase medium subunit